MASDTRLDIVRIKRFLKEIGKTEDWLAVTLEVCSSTVWKWMSKGNIPRGDNLVDLADLMKCPPRELILRDDDTKQSA